MVSYTVEKAGGWSVDRDSAEVLAEKDRGGWKGIEFHQAPEGGQGSGEGPGLYVYAYTNAKVPVGSIWLSNAMVDDGEVYISIGGSAWVNGVSGTVECTIQVCPYDYNTLTRRVTNIYTSPLRFTPSPSETTATSSITGQIFGDYLAGGIWVRVPTDAASVADYEFGAFMDGEDPFEQANLAGLTGTATYEGDARAVYSHQETNRNYFVDADVSLTADFGDADSLGSISGTVSNFEGEGPESDAYEGVSVTLGAAQIGNAESGFFTGDTSTSGTDSAFTGKWGGQFYGNGAAAGDQPGSVAGTFGAATADGGESFVGVYGADR